MPESVAPSRNLAWSDYWQSGSPHSCPGSFGLTYEGCIGAFWKQAVADMREGQRVLDIGTGNGPLPRLISDTLAPGAPRIDAIDAAALRPDWWSAERYPGVRFHPGIGADRMPFQAGTFDWIVSQYGFEYAPRHETVAECRRVIAAGGRIAMVLHHRDSVVCRVGAAELEHQRFLFSDSNLFAAAAAVAPFFARAAAQGPQSVRDDPAAAAARARYNAAMEAIAARIAGLPHGDVLDEARRNVHALVGSAGTRSSAQTLEALQRYADQLRAAQVRTQDMLEHALDESEVRAIGEALASGRHDADVRWQPLRQDEGLLGWALQIR